MPAHVRQTINHLPFHYERATIMSYAASLVSPTRVYGMAFLRGGSADGAPARSTARHERRRRPSRLPRTTLPPGSCR